MSWIILHLASGMAFFEGASLVALGVLIRWAASRKWLSRGGAILPLLGAFIIAISATPLPLWLYLVWSLAMLAWLVRPSLRRSRGWAVAPVAALLALTLAASAWEFSFARTPSIPAQAYPRLYVIGDSISAGIGRETAWPAIVRQDLQVEVVDLPRAGSTIRDATVRVRATTLDKGLVLLEIGGNDIIGRADPAQFERDLEELVSSVEGPGRRPVMMELPLLPFYNRYGLAQRRVAARHQVTLIPRRCFVRVLSIPGATLDALHLSPAGHRAMAGLIGDLLRPHLARQ